MNPEHKQPHEIDGMDLWSAAEQSLEKDKVAAKEEVKDRRLLERIANSISKATGMDEKEILKTLKENEDDTVFMDMLDKAFSTNSKSFNTKTGAREDPLGEIVSDLDKTVAQTTPEGLLKFLQSSSDKSKRQRGRNTLGLTKILILAKNGILGKIKNLTKVLKIDEKDEDSTLAKIGKLDTSTISFIATLASQKLKPDELFLIAPIIIKIIKDPDYLLIDKSVSNVLSDEADEVITPELSKAEIAQRTTKKTQRISRIAAEIVGKEDLRESIAHEIYILQRSDPPLASKILTALGGAFGGDPKKMQDILGLDPEQLSNLGSTMEVLAGQQEHPTKDDVAAMQEQTDQQQKAFEQELPDPTLAEKPATDENDQDEFRQYLKDKLPEINLESLESGDILVLRTVMDIYAGDKNIRKSSDARFTQWISEYLKFPPFINYDAFTLVQKNALRRLFNVYIPKPKSPQERYDEYRATENDPRNAAFRQDKLSNLFRIVKSIEDYKETISTGARDEHVEILKQRAEDAKELLFGTLSLSYYQDFYTKKYKQNLSIAKSTSDIANKEFAAKKTNDDIQATFQFILSIAYGNIIEAGGEPDTELNQAAQKAQSPLGVSPTTLVALINSAFTGLKTASAQVKSDTQLTETLLEDGTHASFAIKVRGDSEGEYIEGKIKKNLYAGRDQFDIGDSADHLQRHIIGLENYFGKINSKIVGHYTMRYKTNIEGAKYYELLASDQFKESISSDTFDLAHGGYNGEKIALFVPLVKKVILRYFASESWLLQQKVATDVEAPHKAIFNYVSDYLTTYYSNMIEDDRRLILYMAFHEAYAHGTFQQIISKCRKSIGFQGSQIPRDGMIFDVYSNIGLAMTKGIDDFISAKHTGRGGLLNPKIMKYGMKVEGEDHTVPYGAMIYYSTGQFGHFLNKTDEHFSDDEKTGEMNYVKLMGPKNTFDTGSDDTFRGWRQLTKSIGNLSRELYEPIMQSDSFTLNEKLTDPNHFIYIWKSIENVGGNYLRTYIDDFIKPNISKLKIGDTSPNLDKTRALVGFIYDRYVSQDTFGAEFLADAGFATGSRESFEASVFRQLESERDAKGKLNKYTVLDGLFFPIYTKIIYERSSVSLMTMVTPYDEQTGETMYMKIQKKYLAKDSGPVDIKKSNGEIDPAKWQRLLDDLLLVETEARGEVTKQIFEKRQSWEYDSDRQHRKYNGIAFNNNIYGDMNELHSDVMIAGSGVKGYRINDKVIRAILSKKLDKSEGYNGPPLSEAEKSARINAAVKLHEDIAVTMMERPDLPEYTKLKKYFDDKVPAAYTKSGYKITSSELVKTKLGSDEKDYQDRYSEKVTTYGQWFMKLWKNKFLCAQPETDAAENLTVYNNADANHIWRMADMVQTTTVQTKNDMADPNGEHSFNSLLKNFAKDPVAACDGLSEWLNGFGNKISDQIGDDAADEFKTTIIQTLVEATLKEDKYRGGWDGPVRELYKTFFGNSRMSIGAVGRVYDGHALSSIEVNRVIHELEKKKLIGGPLGKEFRERYHGTIWDIVKEVSPRLAYLFIVAYAFQMSKTFRESVSEDK